MIRSSIKINLAIIPLALVLLELVSFIRACEKARETNLVRAKESEV